MSIEKKIAGCNMDIVPSTLKRKLETVYNYVSSCSDHLSEQESLALKKTAKNLSVEFLKYYDSVSGFEALVDGCLLDVNKHFKKVANTMGEAENLNEDLDQARAEIDQFLEGLEEQESITEPPSYQAIEETDMVDLEEDSDTSEDLEVENGTAVDTDELYNLSGNEDDMLESEGLDGGTSLINSNKMEDSVWEDIEEDDDSLSQDELNFEIDLEDPFTDEKTTNSFLDEEFKKVSNVEEVESLEKVEDDSMDSDEDAKISDTNSDLDQSENVEDEDEEDSNEVYSEEISKLLNSDSDEDDQEDKDSLEDDSERSVEDYINEMLS